MNKFCHIEALRHRSSNKQIEA